MHVKMKFVYFATGEGEEEGGSNRLIYIAFSLLNYYSSLMAPLKCDFGGRGRGRRRCPPETGLPGVVNVCAGTLSVTFAAC